jgi:GNAT superfamily N-acetyltransferase
LTVSVPEPLAAHHVLGPFNCGAPSLNDWLKRRALRNQTSGASRTYVVCDDTRVIAFYALAASAVSLESATGNMRRNMPYPIPMVVLGRLAVDVAYQGQGLGRGLLQDAGRRVLQAADEVGIRGLIVHAIDESAKAFYHRLGFDESPLDPMTLMITTADLRESL